MKDEIFSIDFNKDKHHNFVPPEKAEDWHYKQIPYDFKLLILEVKSSVPPTGITLEITYTTHESNTVNYLKIPMYKHRRKFKYENELYILDFEDIDSIPEGMRPQTFDFIDKRNKESKATLLYSFNFREP